MSRRRILWIDDEIDSLRSHIFALSERGYEIVPAASGDEGVELLREGGYDAVLLDQVMPGMDGISTLQLIRQVDPSVPVIMVTQSSDESLINEALASKIDDFLIKPLRPEQIVSTLKRVLEKEKLIQDRIPKDYIADFNRIASLKERGPDWREWIKIYLDLTKWDLELDEHPQVGLRETHDDLKLECNARFSEYIEENYVKWLEGGDRPVLSVDLIDKYLVPLLEEGRQVFFVVIDCMRLDQWLVIEPLLQPYFDIRRDYYYSILPTATLYSRNAIFSGLFPKQIAERYPEFWQEIPGEETSSNRYERKLLELKLQSLGLKLKPGVHYFKIFDVRGGEEYLRKVASFERVSLAVLVVDFIDILTHKRSQLDILQQMAPNEPAFRSLTKTWFAHSSFFEIMKVMSQKDAVTIVTSDHGSILGNRASKVFGNKETTTGLRVKVGVNLGCDPDEAFLITEPKRYMLPHDIPGKNYILAKEDFYFVYPNQFHEHKRRFKGGFQHGGISLEEMILPIAIMTPKGRAI